MHWKELLIFCAVRWAMGFDNFVNERDVDFSAVFVNPSLASTANFGVRVTHTNENKRAACHAQNIFVDSMWNKPTHWRAKTTISACAQLELGSLCLVFAFLSFCTVVFVQFSYSRATTKKKEKKNSLFSLINSFLFLFEICLFVFNRRLIE